MVTYRHGKGNYKSGFLSTVRQAGDLTVNNSTTLVDTDLITPTLKFQKSYHIKIYATQNSATTPDTNFGLTITSLVSTYSRWKGIATGVSWVVPDIPLATDIELPGTGADKLNVFEIIVLNVTTKGTLQLQFAQKNAEVSNTKFKKGSVMIVTELG